MGERDTGGSAIMLSGFTLHKQETPVSCGPASAKMALEIMGVHISEAELRMRMKTNRFLGTMLRSLRKGYKRSLRENGIDLHVRTLSGPLVTTRTLVESLEKGRPVIACFFTENHFRPGTMVGHYAVVCGIDPDAGKVYLANPFGTEDEVDIDQFWKSTEFDLSEGKTPFFGKLLMRLGLLFRLLMPKTVIILEDR